MLIDASIFLEVLLEQKKAEHCKKFLEQIRLGNQQMYISTFAIDTILILMNITNVPAEKIKVFLQSLRHYKGLKIYPITMNDRSSSAYFIEKYGFDYGDALVVQSAISCKSSEIVSLNAHFDKVKEIQRIEP